MPVIVAPWLRPADALGAMSSGAGLGLQQRAANQRDAEMAQRMQLAEMQAAQQQAHVEAAQANAAAKLQQDYDALAQARELATVDDKRTDQQNAAQLLLKKSEGDALEKYRQGTLKNQADRNDIQKNRGTAFVPKFHNIGGVGVVEYEPGKVKIADIPGFAGKEAIPRLNIPIDPLETASGRLSTLANDPLINTIMGTNAPPGTGTNYVRQMPKVAQAVAPAGEDLTREEPEPEPVMLDKAKAAEFLKAAGGDKKKARELARAAGYAF